MRNPRADNRLIFKYIRKPATQEQSNNTSNKDTNNSLAEICSKGSKKLIFLPQNIHKYTTSLQRVPKWLVKKETQSHLDASELWVALIKN